MQRRAVATSVAGLSLLLLLAMDAAPQPTPVSTDGGEDTSTSGETEAYDGEDAVSLRLIPGASPPSGPVQIVISAAGTVVVRQTASLPAEVAVPAAPLQVEVSVAGRARFLRSFVPAETRTLRITLPPGDRVSGRVEDAAGRPLVATIDLVSDADPATPWTVTSSADGGFVCDTLPRGASLRLTARADGFAAGSQNVAAGTQQLRIVLGAAASIAGRVQGLDGSSAEGITVTVAGSGLWPPRRATSGVRGRFVFRGLPSGTYELQAFSGDQVAPPRRGIELDAGGRHFITLALEPGRQLRGRVVDALTGEPIDGAEVTISSQGLDAVARATTTGPDGRFTVRGLSPGAYRASVHASSYVPAVGVESAVGAPNIIRLQRGAILAGRVVDAEGRPVAEAQVEVFGEDEARQPIAIGSVREFRGEVFAMQRALPGLEVTQGSVPAIPRDAVAGLETRQPSAGAATLLTSRYLTDDDGYFRIDGVPPGRVWVVARSPGYASASTPRIYLVAGARQEDLELVLAEAGRLRGRIVDAEGRGVEGAVVEVRSDREPYPQVTLSDERGGYALDAVIGELTVTAMPRQRSVVRGRALVESGETTDLDLVIPADLHALGGRALDEAGFPVAGVSLSVVSLRPDAPARRSARANDDGTFAVDQLPPGPWRLEASCADRPTVTLDIAVAASDLRVTLQAGHRVRLHVRDAWTEEPLAAARFEMVREGLPAEVLEGLTNDEGELELASVRAGAWLVRSREPSHQIEVVELDVQDDVELELELRPAGGIAGTVVDRLGRPVPGADVSLEGASSVTDSEGKFRLEGLRPGQAHPRASHSFVGEAEGAAVTVVGGQLTDGAVVHLPGIFDPRRPSERPARIAGVALVPEMSDGDIRVAWVLDHGQAWRTGLRAGDTLLAIDGDTPATLEEARQLLRGSTRVVALVEAQRGDHRTVLRVPREHWFPSEGRPEGE